MRTSELTGALLDYWTGRAEGIEKGQIDLREVQRPDPGTPDMICVRIATANDWCKGAPVSRYDPSTNWALCGPLVEKHIRDLSEEKDGWYVATDLRPVGYHRFYPRASANGGTLLTAICRAVVRAAFGDEVEDLEEPS